EGNLNAMPGKTYIIGYLRNYCKYLDVENEKIKRINQTYKNNENKKLNLKQKEKEKEEHVISFKEKRRRVSKKRENFINFKYLYLAGFVLIVFIGFLYVNNSLREAKNYPVPSPEVETKSDLIDENMEDVDIISEEDAELEKEAKIQEELIQEKLLAKKLPVLELVAHENTWLKILSKDIILFEGILCKNEEMFFKSKQNLNLVTRFPDNVSLHYADKKVEMDKAIKENNIFKYNFKDINENI
ncbi:MAG: helix-turn-helix domain-containing protein, partial [Candidatus Caldatribacteriota bacterium]|nr:helix-turn-helix domain-containing protein [Candidatus Caldatribacteriota bacterium]